MKEIKSWQAKERLGIKYLCISPSSHRTGTHNRDSWLTDLSPLLFNKMESPEIKDGGGNRMCFQGMQGTMFGLLIKERTISGPWEPVL